MREFFNLQLSKNKLFDIFIHTVLVLVIFVFIIDVAFTLLNLFGYESVVSQIINKMKFMIK